MTELDQPDTHLVDAIRHNARFYADRPVVMHGEDVLTWAEFDRRTSQVANALLGQGLARGDRVALLAASSVPAFEVLWGVVKAGGVIVPLNVMLSNEAVTGMLANADLRFLFVDGTTVDVIDEVRPKLNLPDDAFYMLGGARDGYGDASALVASASEEDPWVEISMSDSMSIIYSSGTTGIPKGIEHTHRARMVYPFGCGPMLKIDRHTIALCSTPLYTNGTWITMLPAIYHGGAVVLGGKFSGPGFLELVQRHRVTHAFVVPTQLITILAAPDLDGYDVSSLWMLLSGGAPLTSQTYEEVRAALPDAGIWEIWGITEGFMAISVPEDGRRTVGKPIYGGDVRVIGPDDEELPAGETGELVGWSAALMKGYFRDPERTEAMIWTGPNGRTYLRSGDVGRVDGEGFVYVSGRVKDMIISGGINVYASDIEDVFMKHPDVQEVAVIGIPHEKWGETPVALVIRHQAAGAGEDELKAWANERLGKFQRVGSVEFRDEFPRASHNKVLKRALRDPYWEGLDRTV